jgi:hypothetical protein
MVDNLVAVGGYLVSLRTAVLSGRRLLACRCSAAAVEMQGVVLGLR